MTKLTIEELELANYTSKAELIKLQASLGAIHYRLVLGKLIDFATIQSLILECEHAMPQLSLINSDLIFELPEVKVGTYSTRMTPEGYAVVTYQEEG